MPWNVPPGGRTIHLKVLCLLGGGTLAAIDGVSPLSIIRSLEVGLLTSVLMVVL